jgi:uncharacterized protein DUF5710
MYPIDLTVPESEHAMALQLGARWNEKYAVWYVPRTFNAEPLSRWLTARQHVNVRARTLWLGRVYAPCPICETSIPLHGLVVPAGHSALFAADDPAEDFWQVVEEPAQLYDVAYVSAALQAVLRVHAPTFRLGYSELLEGFGWMNYCRHCRERIEDQGCALDFGSPLNPLDEHMAAKITLKELRVELEATCGSQSCGVQFFDQMPRSCA